MEEKNKSKKRPVDDAGIRLAPTPIRSNDVNVLPTIKQDFVIVPHIEMDEKEELEQENASTLKDYQPKKEEMSKKWKRAQRGKNMIVGAIVFAATAFAIIPFILGAAGVLNAMPFKYVPSEFNAILNFIEAFKETVANGWSGDYVNNVWINTIPDMVLIIGILALIINLIKSLYALFGAVKQVKFIAGAFIYLLSVLALFIASLIGIGTIGIAKIDFVNDFIKGCSDSELFTLVITSIGYLLVCIIVNFVNRDKQGYLV